jgi:hypothetical protein
MRRVLAVAGFLIFPVTAFAQGTLSTQGLGYPAGDLSTRSFSLGGGNAEMDAQSTVNDAAIAGWLTPVLFMQFQPEYRRLTLNGASSNTLTSRFPLAGAALAIGPRTALGLSTTNFLDRSASAITTLNDTIAGERVHGTETFRTLGGINDVRLSAAYRPSGYFRFGVAGHVFTGQNRVISNVRFGDSTSFIPLNQQSTLSYTGLAASAGVEVRLPSALILSASGRKGGFLDMHSGDSVLAHARVPNRFGAGVQFSGISGLSLSGRISRDLWTALKPLGSAGMSTFDTWDGGVGAEAAASHSSSRLLQLRAGARYRGLPFGIKGQPVHELSFGGGFGLQLSHDRAQFDAGLLRANRFTGSFSNRGAASERAYTISFGLRIRP